MNILIIEEEPELLSSMATSLSKEGFHCEVANSLALAREKAWLYNYDCVVVDSLLPDGSGLDVIDSIKRKKSKTGIIIVSGKGTIEDRIHSLNIGADDYLSKPFDLGELNARIKALIRRNNFEGQNDIELGDLHVNPYNHTAMVGDQTLNLTKKEFDLLLYFISNPNRVITKEKIAEHLWGDEMEIVHSYDFIYSQMKNLRKKIADKGGLDSIETIYGIGYKIMKN